MEKIISLVLIIGVIYIIYVVGRNNWCYDYIMLNRIHFDNMLKYRGFELKDVIGGFDLAPCECKFMIVSKDVCIVDYSRKILNLIRKISKNSISKEKLVSMSKWEYVKLPKL